MTTIVACPEPYPPMVRRPEWATETDGSLDFMSHTATLYSGLILPDPHHAGVTVEVQLIAWQHNQDDRTPAGHPYIEVAGSSEGSLEALLILPPAEARSLARALLAAADTIDAQGGKDPLP